MMILPTDGWLSSHAVFYGTLNNVGHKRDFVMMLILQELRETIPHCTLDNVSCNDIKKESLTKEEVLDTFY